MVAVSPDSEGPDINIETFEHNLEQHEIWRLYIIVNFNDSPNSFYLLATFARIIRALFPGLNGFLMMVRFLVDKIPDPIAHISQHFPLALLSGNWVTMPGHRIQVMIFINSNIKLVSDTD